MMKKFALSLLIAAVFASTIAVAGNACLTPGYWKNHPDDWPMDSITIGGVTYSKAEAIGILDTPPKGDATYILAHALIAAKLNRAMGWIPVADPLIADADAFLSSFPLDSDPSNPDRAVAIDLAEQLDVLNNIPGADD